MENYVVSARKYRPQAFREVVGQQHITETLEKAIVNNHLAQAMLFCGPRGVGKTTCARIVAHRINEVTGGNPDNDYSLNIIELDAASNNGVDEMRNLTDQVRYAPQVGKYKVYIIDEVHMLSTSAFNAFLKTLEEPPAHAIFILATTEKHKIIPTILSRCQIFDFKRIGVNDIAKHLAYVAESEGITADENALHLIAQKADGALRDSLSIFDRIASFSDNQITYQSVLDNLNILDYDYYFRVIDFALANNPTGLYLLYNEILTKGFDGHLFVNGLASHVRDLMMCYDPQTVNLLEVSDDLKAKYLTQAKACTLHQIFRWLNVLNECDQKYKSSANQRLLVEIALSQLTQEYNEATQMVQKKKPEPSVKTTAPIPSKTTTSNPAAETKVKTSEGPKPEVPPVAAQTVASEVPKPVEPEPPKISTNISSGKKKRRSGFSISGVLNEEKTNTKAAEGEEEYIDYGSKPFTETQIIALWEKYANDQKENKPLYAILSKKPKLISESELELELDSTVQEAILMQSKNDLLKHLRSTLENSAVYLKHTIKELEKVNLIYTPEEKFKYMAEKNPALLELKKRLDMNY
ncbi:MAG: DNA polymerase III subunit gamma/tau [Schleiferiaceae bacterium]|nr:DNA polymerase III subunit gamma/tau [Schleiferiaceae bacterium]